MNQRRWVSFIHNVRFQSLFIKNLILIMALTFVPFAATGLVVYYQMNGIVQEEISSVNLNSLYQTRDVVDTIITQTDLLATKLSLQPEVELFVFSHEPEQIITKYYSDIYRSISMFTNVYRYINSIYIYSDVNQYIIANSRGTSLEKFADDNWYPEFKRREDNEPWVIPRKQEDRYPYFITLVRPTYIYNQVQNGGVIVNIDVEELGKVISGQRAHSDETLYIVDEAGTILFSNIRDEFMLNYKDSSMLAGLSLQEGSGPTFIGEQEYIRSITRSEVFGWTFVSILPVQHYQENIQQLRTFMYTFSVVGFIVIIILSFIISARTFAPVKKIMSAFEQPLKRQSEELHTPELTYILGNITKYIHSQRELESELDRRLDLLNKARSVALQSQINPHFLFNTLDTIKWTAIRLTGGENETSAMISSLSELMRLSMDSDSHLIPLSIEIEHARKYVDIIQYRYGDRVHVHWDFAEQLLEFQIIQLSLQPLIENAVYHGIKPTRRKGNIWVSGEVIGTNLIIKVRDDGKGIDPKQIERLNEEFQIEQDLSGKHIGLRNVNQRIRLIFGHHYGLTMHSDGVQGTTITIWLKAVR